MITGYIVIGLFVLTALISLLERYTGKYTQPLYILLGVVLILVAGFREIGIDPDSINYEYSFLHYNSGSQSITDYVEFSFIWISAIINQFTNDVHALFVVYAVLGLGLKFVAFRRLTEFWFLPVLVYLGDYYITHEMMQIRTGVLSGLFLLAIYYQVEHRKMMACLLILIGSCFHYSGFILLPLLFLSSDYMSRKKRLLWVSALPISYVIFFLGVGILMSLDIPLIGAKLAAYQASEEQGRGTGYVNVFRPLHLFTIALMLYLLCFYDTIVEKSKYFTLLFKIFIIGLCSYQVFGFLPVLAQRVNMLLLVVTIPLFTYIYYTIRPVWAAILTIIFIAFIYLNYRITLISTVIFWEA